ncbi:MAG: hypothetical protein LLH30_05385 [Candidatus Manganitrophus sp. SA1]|nr:hypothetical protein [Candidatus Manganitrophus morganii]
MKKRLMIGILSAALIGAGSLTPIYAAGEQDPGAAQGDQGAGGMAQGQKLTGVEVTEINKDQGTVQIKKQEGGQETLKLDPSQKAQLDQIQKGDKVDITMVERGGEKVATSISKSG